LGHQTVEVFDVKHPQGYFSVQYTNHEILTRYSYIEKIFKPLVEPLNNLH